MQITIAQSYFSTRPGNHSDRVFCLHFVETFPTSGLHSAITATVGEYLPLVGVYDAARVANEAAATKVALDSDRQHRASDAFTNAFDKWTLKIDDANGTKGYAASALKGKLDNQSFSDFLRSPDVDKVARMPTVFAHVADVPSLVGTPETYRALQAATDVLRAAVGVHDRSLAVRTTTARALYVAERAHDKAYGYVVKDVERFDPNGLGQVVPMFRRVRKVKQIVPDNQPDPPVPQEIVPVAV